LKRPPGEWLGSYRFVVALVRFKEPFTRPILQSGFENAQEFTACYNIWS
jgi:hypothetical protein